MWAEMMVVEWVGIKVDLLVGCSAEHSAENSAAWSDHVKAGSWDPAMVVLWAAAMAGPLVDDSVDVKVVSKADKLAVWMVALLAASWGEYLAALSVANLAARMAGRSVG